MRKIGTGLVAVVLFCLLATTSGHAAGAISLEEAINQAGRQRMLTQRMVKAYALIGQRVSVGRAYDQLDASVVLFGKQLSALRSVADSAEEKASLKKVERLWRRFKKAVTAKPDRKKAPGVDKLAEATLKEADRFVGLLEKRSGKAAGHLTNLAGRQRMLSQRMAKFYVLRSWGLDLPAYREGFDTAVDDFENALRGLKNSEENTDAITRGLDDVTRQWHLFGLSKVVGSGRFVPSLVTRSMDKILDRMNTLTAEYANLGKNKR